MTMNVPVLPASQELLSPGVFQLREWGTERRHSLPNEALRCQLGSAHRCAVRLVDPRVLPVHAQLTRERQRWLIRGLGDEAGLRRDGALSGVFSLEPGVEIGVGRATLIAEDERWAALRAFCARLLGWGSGRGSVVDRALRSIRTSMTHRAPLVLRGEGDMVPIAHALHRRALGGDRPFVVCDPRRREQAATARAPQNCATVSAALSAAVGGSVCVRARRLPRDFPALLGKVSEPGANIQLIVCGSRTDTAVSLSTPIVVPPLATRAADLPRIIAEYAQDAISALGAPVTSFEPDGHRWVLDYAARSLDEIEKATLRFVAVRSTPSFGRAAAPLGIAPVSLYRWLARRNLGP